MKTDMKMAVIWRGLPLLALVALLCGGEVRAQWSQEQVCRGWNNPTSFTVQGGGSYVSYYQGRTGNKGSLNPDVAPNASTGQTGVDWHTSQSPISNSNMATTTMVTGGDCAIFPSNKPTNYAFAIYDTNTQVSGHPKNRDPNTGDNLYYVPTWFNTNDPDLPVQTTLSRSIRIGSACGRSGSTVDNAVALYYNIHVTPQNALLYLYYACVFEAPGHGLEEDPAFMIRVMKQNDAGQWVQASPTNYYPATGQCDTLAYFVTGTPYPEGTVQNGVGGWHIQGSGYNSVYWKDWAKVVVNLTPMMYDDVRVEVMVHGCSMTQHYAYAYICGECRAVEITSSGCPAGMATDVTTLTAPRGMDNYVWYRSEYGGSTPTSNTTTFSLPNDHPNSTAYYTFHQLTPDEGTSDTSYRYKAQSEDFYVEYRPNAAHQQGIAPSEPDSMCNKQIFLCKVRSAIDPSKPYETDIYAIVQNIKPTMEVATNPFCGGDVELANESFVPGNQSMVMGDSTIWSFYSNPVCQGDPDTVMRGANVSIHYDGPDVRYVKVRTNIDENDPTIPNSSRPEHNACYSEAIYPIQPLPNPVGGFAIDNKVLCMDNPRTTVRDTTSQATYREWHFRNPEVDTVAIDGVYPLSDTVVANGEDNRALQRTFTFDMEPMEMTVRNGLFYLNPLNQDTVWCENTIADTVYVFQNPELQVEGDSIVCMGERTDVTVSTPGIEGCHFQWSLTNGTITGGFPEGPRLQVEPYADTSVYYVRVKSDQDCEAWGSARAYRVNPQLKMVPEDGQICPGDTVRIRGYNAHHYSWSATPDDPSLTSQDSLRTIYVTPQVNTTYTLVGHGSNNCNATPLTTSVTVHPYPVPVVTLDPSIIDSENPVTTLRDDSPYSVASMWTFAGAEQVVGHEVTHTFEEATGADSVYVTLTNANDIGCQTVYPFSIPVNLYTAWFPNVFTPGSEDENATFRLYSINVYEIFHIYIYNRFGQLVFESSDPLFEWNGKAADGTPCPQGTYTYICRYRKPGAYTVMKLYGSISLVR